MFLDQSLEKLLEIFIGIPKKIAEGFFVEINGGIHHRFLSKNRRYILGRIFETLGKAHDEIPEEIHQQISVRIPTLSM